MGQLCDRYAERIFRFAVSRTHDVPDAEDVVSDAFVTAFAVLDSYRWTSAPSSGWLFGIAQNKLRKRGTSDACSDAEAVNELASEHDPLGSFERRHDMPAQIRRLMPEHQQILMLRLYESMTAQDVARAIGSNANAVGDADASDLLAAVSVPRAPPALRRVRSHGLHDLPRRRSRGGAREHHTRAGHPRSRAGESAPRIHLIAGIANQLSAAESRAVMRVAREYGPLGASMYDVAAMGPEDWRALRHSPANPLQPVPMPMRIGTVGTFGHGGGVGGARRR